MISRSAAFIVERWERAGVIMAEERDSYRYGMELIISTGINLVVMIVISLLAGRSWSLVPYLVSFIPLRLLAGGYHAKNHIACICLNGLLYLSCVLANAAIPSHLVSVFCFMSSSFSTAMVFIFAPTAARNKPLSAAERKRCRAKSLWISIGLLSITAVLFIAGGRSLPIWSRTLCFGQASACVLMLMERASMRLEKRAHDL